MTVEARSGMFVGMLSTFAPHRSVRVASACTRIYDTGVVPGAT